MHLVMHLRAVASPYVASVHYGDATVRICIFNFFVFILGYEL